MELGSCVYGYAGIPQDSRLTFDILRGSSTVEVSGLILDNRDGAAGVRPGWRERTSATTLATASRFIARLGDRGVSDGVLLPGVHALTSRLGSAIALIESQLRLNSKPFPIDSEVFGDFIWQTIFSNTLPAERKSLVLQSPFYGCGVTLTQLVASALLKLPPLKIDTGGFDYFIVQKPQHVRVSAGTRLVIRYHDSIPLTHPHSTIYPKITQRAHQRSLTGSIASDALYVCNSEATQADLTRWHPALRERSCVVNCCVSDEFYPEASRGIGAVLKDNISPDVFAAEADINRHLQEAGEKAADCSERYFLAVGSMEPRKNYGGLLDAWEKFSARGHRDVKLVLVASNFWNQSELVHRLQRRIAAGDVIVVSGLDTPALRLVYSNALATISASFVEGFNITGVESMQCGTPVLASEIAVHREIYGAGARYFDPHDAAALADTMEAFVSVNEAESTRISRVCREIAGQYARPQILAQWQRALA